MRGTIRVIVGLVITFGAAGGLDNATDAQLIPCIILAVAGLGIMYSGVRAMRVE